MFAGGCTLPAAESLCQAELDTLQALVDRSLLQADGGRYWMLQTLRENALERLAQTSDEDWVRRAHAEWFIELLETERLPQPGWPTEQSLRSVAPSGIDDPAYVALRA